MGLAAVTIVTVLFLTTDVLSWAPNGNRTGHRFLDEASFSRFNANFNSDNNASLYLPRLTIGKRSDDSDSPAAVPPANETAGRSLDLDTILSGASSSASEERDSGDRESRIINDGPKHEIQGFIPIISLKQQAPRHPPPSPIPHPGFPQPQFDSYDSMTQAIHQQPLYPQFTGHELPQRGVFGGLGAALQTLKMKRKQGYDQSDLVPGRDCLCVPFYMCKNGFLEGTAKNAPSSGGNSFLGQQSNPMPLQSPYNSMSSSSSSKEYFDQQVAAAQAELAANIPPNFNPFNQMNGQQQQSSPSPSERNNQYKQSQAYPSPVYDASNLDQSLPLDERSIDPPSEQQGRSTHFPSNASDTSESARQYSPHESRMLGMSGGNSCGVLRTCCRFAPEFATGPIVSQRPIQTFGGNYGQNGFVPQTYQPVPQLPVPQSSFYRPPNGLKRPLLPSGGSFELLSASLLKPKSTSYAQPAYGVMQSTSQFSNKPFLKPPTRRLINSGPNFGPGFQPQRSQFQSIPQPLPSFSHNSIGHLQPSSVNYGQCGARSAVSTQGRVQNLQYPEATAEFGEYPWQAALLKRIGPQDSLYVCGGVLISPNFILTAAHCIKENRAEDLKVRLGEWDVHRDDEFYPYVERFVQEVIIHPDFQPGNLNNDIALIRFESPVDFSSPHIAPACMPESFDQFVGQRCWVTGWGKNSFGHQGEYQSVLREVDLPVMSQDVCERSLRNTRLGPYYQLFPGFLCAGGERGKDACEGDGGSPLVCEVSGGWKVAGLVSWGIGCGTPGVPGVYASVAYYRQWIDSMVSRYAARSLASESFEDNSYAPAGIIQERSNDANDTILSTAERDSRSLGVKKLTDAAETTATTTANDTLTTGSPMLPISSA